MNPQKLTADSWQARALRIAALAMLTMLIWCSAFNRWTASNWNTPLDYLSEPEKGDIIANFAAVKVAQEGKYVPFAFTTIPELGAPFQGNWNDYPTTEKPLLCVMGLFADVFGIFAAANIVTMLGYVLSALSFYAACRLLRCERSWSFAGALVFAFSRFAISHGEHHITVAYVWHIPLCLVVCGWVVSEEGLKIGERRYWLALAVAFVTGVQNVYFTNMFAQFVLFGGLLQWWRRHAWGAWRAALPAACIIGTAAAAFILMNMNTFIYHMIYGPNHGAVVRAYRWLEIYALKIVDLVVPPPDHHVDLFARFSAYHIGNAPLPPGEVPLSGYIGLVGLAALVWLLAASLKKAADNKRLPFEAWQILWILLYSEVGGINGLAGTFGFLLFRSATRYSIYVMCIVLMYAVRQLSALKFKTPLLAYGVPAVVALFALWDQLPSHTIVAYVESAVAQDRSPYFMRPQNTDEALAENAGQVASDRRFTERMEQRLPPGAMVFQLPIMEFPESPAPGVGAFDHLRPFLYSQNLRYSFGSDKGRQQAKWQQEFTGLSVPDVIARLERYGFGAVYVNRNGYPDKGEAIVKAFKEAGRVEILDSERKDLFCVFLKPSPQPVLPGGGLYHK